MPSEIQERYEFGDFRLDVKEHRIERIDGAPCSSLPEKSFQILTLLVRYGGSLVTKEEIFSRVWPDTSVEENNLDKAVHTIRHFLGEAPGGEKYVETVRKHGYRLVAEVRRIVGKGTGTAFSVDEPAPPFVEPQNSALGNVFELKSAFEAVQQARIKYYHQTELSTLEARSYLDQAVRLDPEFAPAYSLSAELSTLEVIVGLRTPGDGFTKARAAIKRAFELGADSEDYYSAAGYVDLIADWDFGAAEANLRKSLSINPHSGSSNRKMGELLMFQGRHEEAADFVRRAQVDELTGMVNANILAISRFLARDYSAVLGVCDRMLELSPRHLIPSWTKCWAFEQMGRVDQAITGYEKILRSPQGAPALRWAGYAFALAGERERAIETIASLEALSYQHNISPTHIAAVYAGLGEIDKAIPHIEKGFDRRDPFMLWIGTDPRFDNLRPHPRFKNVIDAIGFFAWKERSGGSVRSEMIDELVSSRATLSGAHRLIDVDEWIKLNEKFRNAVPNSVANLEPPTSEGGELDPVEQ